VRPKLLFNRNLFADVFEKNQFDACVLEGATSSFARSRKSFEVMMCFKPATRAQASMMAEPVE